MPNYKRITSAWILVYHVPDKKLLVLQRSATTNQPNLWNFPGGKTDGQKPRIAAARELWEEAGIRVNPNKLLKLPKRYLPLHDTRYYILPVTSYPKVKIDHESQGFKWERPEDIRRNEHNYHYKSFIAIKFDVLDKLTLLRQKGGEELPPALSRLFTKEESIMAPSFKKVLAAARTAVRRKEHAVNYVDDSIPRKPKNTLRGQDRIAKYPNPTGPGCASGVTQHGVPLQHANIAEQAGARLAAYAAKAAGKKPPEGAHWWDLMDEDARKAYLQEHPNSIYAHETNAHALLKKQGMKINKSYDNDHVPGQKGQTGNSRLTHFYDPKSRTHGVLHLDKTAKGHVGQFSVRLKHKLPGKFNAAKMQQMEKEKLAKLPQQGKDFDWFDDRHHDKDESHTFKTSSPKFAANNLNHFGTALNHHLLKALKHGHQSK